MVKLSFFIILSADNIENKQLFSIKSPWHLPLLSPFLFYAQPPQNNKDRITEQLRFEGLTGGCLTQP